jgi:hypothetical protein
MPEFGPGRIRRAGHTLRAGAADHRQLPASQAA